MRYLIHHHPAFQEPLSRDDLYGLVERGSLARGDLCRDVLTGRDHTVGELISGMTPPRGGGARRLERPAFQEIRVDDPVSGPLDVNEAEVEEMAETEEGPDADEGEAEWTDGGERVLYHGHPSWLSYLKVLFLALLLAVAAGMLFFFDLRWFTGALGAAFLVLIGVILTRFTHDYLVTDERVEVVWGVVGRSSKEVRIRDIRSIDVTQRGLGGLLGLGTVDFSSSANAGVEVQFRNIFGAHGVKKLVRQLQREAGE